MPEAVKYTLLSALLYINYTIPGMKKLLQLLIFHLFFTGAYSQTVPDYNLDLEHLQKGQSLPEKWFLWGRGYTVVTDSTEKFSNRRSVVMRAPQEIPSGAFGCVASALPAIYEGGQIELRGYMKLSGVEGAAGLMLRIDGKSGTLQFNNMQGEKIRGTEDWKQYSIRLPYPPQAASIYIGAILTGKGTLWVDNFELYIDGKPLSEAQLKKPVAAVSDKEFDNGSGISFPRLTPSLIDDLAYTGKLWGFLKYYHPAISKGDFNWDYELFRVLPAIKNASDPAEKEDVLVQWIRKLGPLAPDTARSPETRALLTPDFAWMERPSSGKELVSLLEQVKRAGRSDVGGYYISLAPGVGNPEFRNEEAYSNMPYPDAGFRLLSLFRYWNMIAYFFPYKSLIKENWDDVLREFVPRFLEARDEAAYQLAALELIARVKDTHATLHNPGKALETLLGNRYSAAELSYVEEKPVVAGFFNASLSEESGLKVGDIIEKIDGRNVESIIAGLLPYTPASNKPTQLRNLSLHLLRSNNPALKVQARREGRPLDIEVPTYEKSKINLYANYNKQDTCFRLIRPDVAYLFPGKFKNRYLDALTPEINKTRALIIDLRCYPSDFMVFTVGSMLLPEARPFVKFTNGSLKQPGLFSFTPALSVGGNNPAYYKGKVILLVNERTLSQSEYTAMAFSQAPDVVIVGSTTAGADGNVSMITLPGNIRTAISGIGVYYPDGRETQQVGIIPDVEIRPTIRGILEGRDEVLEKALEIVR